MIKIKQTNKKKHRKGTKTRNDTWSTIVAIKKKQSRTVLVDHHLNVKDAKQDYQYNQKMRAEIKKKCCFVKKSVPLHCA